MRPLFLSALFLALIASLSACGDDDDSGTDDAAACQAACEAEYADDIEGCDVCGVDFVFDADTGDCGCSSLTCVSELCTEWCVDTQGMASGSCYLDSCTCA